jgi:hypothetical protein
MNLDKLYDIAENENIKIYDYCIDEDINGIFLNYDKLNAIALNCDNSLQEKCVLSEELGHYYMDATYNYANVDKITYDKQEYRAKKWSYYVLIPFENLRRAILNRN